MIPLSRMKAMAMILFKAEMAKTPLPAALEMATSISPVILTPPIPLKPLTQAAMILSMIGAAVPSISVTLHLIMSIKFTAVAVTIQLPVQVVMIIFLVMKVLILSFLAKEMVMMNFMVDKAGRIPSIWMLIIVPLQITPGQSQ